MKKFLTICFFAASLTAANSLTAQTTYNITENIKYSASKMPAQCDGCIINISKGVTLTVDQEVKLQNTTVNGGTIEMNNNQKLFAWGKMAFNNLTLIFPKSSFETSGTLTITNTYFEFYKNSDAVIHNGITMIASGMKFLDNSNMLANSGAFIMKSNSFISAGDGTTKSTAYLTFNGAILSEYDNSYVTVANYTNYYFNWSNYNSIPANKSISTTNNSLNCGTSGKNACDAPRVYGPATIGVGGVSSSATLPVKLTAFAVVLKAGKAELTWTTDMEVNASRYEIERSIDGLNWKVAGTVKAKGNSSVVIKYSFTDASAVNGMVSYRLKIVDIDETAAYSPIKTVKAETAVREMSVYPNPATDYVVISSKNSSDKMNVQLINYNGQVLKQANGNGKVDLSVNEFTSGSYMVRVSDSTGTAQSFKLMIAK